MATATPHAPSQTTTVTSKHPSGLGLLLIWTLAVISLLYFLPLAIAFSRGHKDTGPIFLVDLFLGWTLVGWVVALVWACKSMKV
jgi:4-amino-4-deoxy-L-arabinose transferase-like glycosyltransferase